MRALVQKLEAILLVTGEALSFKELADLLECHSNDVQAAAKELQEALVDHGISILISPDSVRLVTSPAVSEWIGTVWAEDAPELTAAGAETLAIVAYRGPVTRGEVEAVRGVDCRRIIRQLVRSDLIRAIGSSQNPQYIVTDAFLRNLGLSSVEQLPDFAVLSSDEKIAAVLEGKV